MSNTEKYKGQHFIFHIINDHGQLAISMSSDYVYPYVEKDDLKQLAEFILNYLENN